MENHLLTNISLLDSLPEKNIQLLFSYHYVYFLCTCVLIVTIGTYHLSLYCLFLVTWRIFNVLCLWLYHNRNYLGTLYVSEKFEIVDSSFSIASLSDSIIRYWQQVHYRSQWYLNEILAYIYFRLKKFANIYCIYGFHLMHKV